MKRLKKVSNKSSEYPMFTYPRDYDPGKPNSSDLPQFDFGGKTPLAYKNYRFPKDYNMKTPGDNSLPPVSVTPKLAYTRPLQQPGSLTSINPNLQPTINSSNTTTSNVAGSKFPWKKIVDTAENLTPYASNIINMFRKPVSPPNPTLDPGITLQKVNMDNDRAMVERGVRGANMNADKTLDENTAQSVKQYNLAQRFNQLSQVNQSERNANTEIANREVELNSNITARNNMKQDQLGRDRVEMQLANQREKSANIANAADKYISINNEKAKSNLDLKKFGLISAAYNQNGVATRKYKTLAEAMQDPVNLEYMNNGQGQNENAIMDKLNANYLARRQKELSQKKYGGMMKYSTGGMIYRNASK